MKSNSAFYTMSCGCSFRNVHIGAESCCQQRNVLCCHYGFLVANDSMSAAASDHKMNMFDGFLMPKNLYFDSVGCYLSSIAGSALALHCCKAHAKINRKVKNSSPVKS